MTEAGVQEQRSEYQIGLEGWLRRRFVTLCIAYLIWGAIRLCQALWTLWNLADAPAPGGGDIGVTVLRLIVYPAGLAVVGCFVMFSWRHLHTRRQLTAAATRLILTVGLLTLLFHLAQHWLAPAAHDTGLTDLGFWHLTACLFLPWTWRESLKPMTPLLIAWAIITLILDLRSAPWQTLLIVGLGPAVLLPGIAIAYWRLQRYTRRFRLEKLGRRFLAMRQELTRVRTIHEGVFPESRATERFTFDVRYRPMRELGGDLVHLHDTGSGPVHLTIIDVTGHGLAAALFVNRLHGELERIFGETPDIGAGRVLELLDRYIHLTMSMHQIYATVACVRINLDDGAVEMASGGHPPVFVRRAGGAVDELGATTAMLGAMPDGMFSAPEQHTAIAAGDTIIVYTDGVYESRDRHGDFFGLERLRGLLQHETPDADHSWPTAITTAVDLHAGGRSQDDILVAALTMVARAQPIDEKQTPAEPASQPTRENVDV